MANERRYSKLDQFLMQIDAGLRTIFATHPADRPSPAAEIAESQLADSEKRHVAGLMRVNHSGEVCAQALYQGQQLCARNDKTGAFLQHACAEEVDHLAWTAERVQQMGSHTSYLNSFWYFNSFLIGAVASAFGDQWSLGFVEETERQVTKHLEGHLGKLPEQDAKSRAIVAQMRDDEQQHSQSATNLGARELPGAVKWMMSLHGRVMTTVSYWI